MSTLDEELIALEREGWAALSGGAGASFYREHLDRDALMALPTGVLNVEAALAAIESSPPWESYEMFNPRVVALTDDSGVLVYGVTARRGGEDPYSALISSVFVRREGEWKLAFHGQTPMRH